jgi:ADP-ribose pyrophosphatase YjhB (NUDIX family)
MIAELAGVVWKRLPFRVRSRIIRVTQDKFTVSAAAVITNESGMVLLLDHRIRPSSGWGLPGGFIEHGEQPDEGIRREIREETGLELTGLRLIRTRIVRTHLEIIFLAVASGEPEIRSREIRDLGWFGRDELPELLNSAQKKLIQSLLKSEVEKT